MEAATLFAEMIGDTATTLVQVLLAGIASLAGAVGFLYRQQKASHEYIAAKLTDCENDRLELWEAMAHLRRSGVESDKISDTDKK